MYQTTRQLTPKKRIALVAHDHQKANLLDWCQQHRSELAEHCLFATGTTGHQLEAQLEFNITKLMSGPLGGDQQLGALITEGQIDILIFFWDPLEAVPHDPDVKALLRLAAVWNIPVACNRASAEFMLSSPLLNQSVTINIPDYQRYLQERLQG